MNKLTFERNGELFVDITANSTSDFEWGEIDICNLTYDDWMSFNETKQVDIVHMLMHIADELFEYDGETVINTNITLVDDNKNFIWSVIVEAEDDGYNFTAGIVDWSDNENHYRYVVDEENHEYKAVDDDGNI